MAVDTASYAMEIRRGNGYVEEFVNPGVHSRLYRVRIEISFGVRLTELTAFVGKSLNRIEQQLSGVDDYNVTHRRTLFEELPLAFG